MFISPCTSRRMFVPLGNYSQVKITLRQWDRLPHIGELISQCGDEEPELMVRVPSKARARFFARLLRGGGFPQDDFLRLVEACAELPETEPETDAVFTVH